MPGFQNGTTWPFQDTEVNSLVIYNSPSFDLLTPQLLLSICFLRSFPPSINIHGQKSEVYQKSMSFQTNQVVTK